MRFQKRDGDILSAIHHHDGMLARRHLKAMFWPTSSLRAMQKRLAILVDNGYLARPTSQQQRTHPISEPLFWLGWRGILWIAGQANIGLTSPKNSGENQLRKLANQLKDAGLHWVREPRWNQLWHDLAVIDVHLAVEHAVDDIDSLSLGTWQYESVFRSDGDLIKYEIPDRNGQMQKRERFMYPDSYFVLTNQQRAEKGMLSRARLLLELDHATHSNARFGREKVAPGLAYIRSAAYKQRFGDNSGRWLVVTTGERRMHNLMRQTEQMIGRQASTFLFTTFDRIEEGILSEPIWNVVGQDIPIVLLDTNQIS